MIAPFLNQSLALDIIKDAPPAAAYALRKLKSGYKGAPIRVRRSNDDEELDIPFCGQYLCIGTLMAFVTTNSGFVTTAYDQSGNGNHATQTTAANQPRIVNAGVLDVDAGGKPTMISPDNLALRGLFCAGASISSICSMSVVAKSYEAGRIFGFGDNTFDTNLLLGCADAGSNLAVGVRLPESQLITSGSIRSQSIVSYVRTSTILQQGWINGVSIGTNTNLTTTFTGEKIGIGYLSAESPVPIEYNFSESIIFSIALSATQRQKLERNQSKYYQIAI